MVDETTSDCHSRLTHQLGWGKRSFTDVRSVRFHLTGGASSPKLDSVEFAQGQVRPKSEPPSITSTKFPKNTCVVKGAMHDGKATLAIPGVATSCNLRG